MEEFPGLNITGTNVGERLDGTQADDTLRGAGGNDSLFGGAGDDRLEGNGDNDLITGNTGADTIIGHDGIDIARFIGIRSNFDVARSNDNSIAVEDEREDLLDTLIGIERITFNNGDLLLDLSGGDVSYIYRLYQAAFDRTPDEAGLRHWVGELEAGRVTRKTMAEAFVESAEFQALVGVNPTNLVFVSEMYDNVLDRDPDPVGFQHWNTQLNSGAQDFAGVLRAFSESPENVAQTQPNLEDGVWTETPQPDPFDI